MLFRLLLPPGLPPPLQLVRETWGSKLKTDVVKPILGLSCHPTDHQQLLLLHGDGFLRGYAPSDRGAGDLLTQLYSVQGGCLARWLPAVAWVWLCTQRRGRATCSPSFTVYKVTG